MIQLRSRLPAVGTTIFTVMSRLAAEVGAINLSQGFPDFDCDPELVEAVARHMRDGRNQYAPMPGLLALREAIASMYRSSMAARYDPETEITITSGATEAIFDAVAAVRPPRRRGHRPRAVLRLLRAGDRAEWRHARSSSRCGLPDYSVDWDAVRRAITPRTRLLLINTPHNPTGAVLSAEDIASWPRWSSGTGRHRRRRRGLPAHHLRRPASREPRAA